MPTLTIDGREITVEPGTRIIDAADRLGIDIPRFCYHPGLSVAANCRMCLVESSKSPKPVPSCYETCQDGQVIQTASPKVLEGRRSVLEFILLNHPVDCPICDQAGECDLQDLYFAHDHRPSRHEFRKHHKTKARILGPNVVYDAERCINCTRCIRVCAEVAEDPQLVQVQRGERAFIDVFPGGQLDHAYSLCTVDVCPVGALTSRDFRFKCRAWLTAGTDSVCAGCSRGCSVRVDTYRNAVQRLVPRHNPQVNQYWACDGGRLSYHRYEAGRLAACAADGQPSGYAAALRAVAEGLSGAAGKGVAVVLSAGMTCEDAWAVATAVRAAAPDAAFAVGGVGPGDEDKVLMRADRNANRNGVMRVLGGLGVSTVGVGDVVAKAPSLGALLVFGEQADEAALAGALRQVPLPVVHGPLAGEASAAARFAFPGVSPFEAAGTFVNEFGIAQRVRQAVRPAGDARDAARWATDLADRRGVPLPALDGAGRFAEVARLLPALAGKGPEDLGKHGVALDAASQG